MTVIKSPLIKTNWATSEDVGGGKVPYRVDKNLLG